MCIKFVGDYITLIYTILLFPPNAESDSANDLVSTPDDLIPSGDIQFTLLPMSL